MNPAKKKRLDARKVKVYRELKTATRSKYGWVYCLESPDGQYVKVGMTTHTSLTTRLKQVARPIYQDMIFSWAIRAYFREGQVHKGLTEHRCIYVSDNDKKIITSKDRSQYKTEREKDKIYRHRKPTIELFKTTAENALQVALGRVSYYYKYD